LERFVVRIQRIPHELADKRVPSVEVVADAGVESPTQT
jgi:hypothetical protein